MRSRVWVGAWVVLTVGAGWVAAEAPSGSATLADLYAHLKTLTGQTAVKAGGKSDGAKRE